MFLRLDDQISLGLGGGGEGPMAPSVNVDVFGQDLGISVDLSGLTEWNPSAALGDASLLGLIELSDIIDPIDIGSVGPCRSPASPGWRSS